MARWVRVLGFADQDDATKLHAAMSAIPGPAITVVRACGVAGLAQADAGRLSFGLNGAAATLRHLRTVQLRMEAACALAAFLPADPAHACCEIKSVPGLIDHASTSIRKALASHGSKTQWDVILRWRGETVVAARREEIATAAIAAGGGRVVLAEAVAAALAHERDRRDLALRQVISQVALAMVPAGSDQTEVGITVLMPANGEAALESALGTLPNDIANDSSIDLRGPLPPLSFATVRIDRAPAADLAAAWQVLALPDEVDSTALRRHWRDCAARLHPDRGNNGDAPMAAAGAAFRLLGGLLSDDTNGRRWSLAALQRHAAWRMSVQALENIP